MTSVLVSGTNRDERVKAAEWFQRATPSPEMSVPVLLKTLEASDGKVSEASARALAAYEARAALAVERLQLLAKTDYDPVAWGAFHALAHIDPEAAMKTGVRWSRNPVYTEYWRTNRNMKIGPPCESTAPSQIGGASVQPLK
jgi:hypothetical protein